MAPLALKLVAKPGQMALGLALATNAGPLLTMSCTVLLLVHPAELPTTEYVVVIVGETLAVLPFKAPGVHV